MVTNSDILARRGEAIPRGVGNACSIVPARAKNSEIWDVEGRRYIDFASGISVLNVGHQHPRVVAAVKEQLERYSHPAFQVMPYEPYVALAERLNALTPGDFPKKTIFFTTGAEAVENAVKIARAHTARSGVIAFAGGFHGRTMLTLAMTGKVVPYKTGFGPFPGEVYHVPYPLSYHGITADDSIAAIQWLFKSDIEPSRVAALVVEPVLGEGGFYVAPTEFLRRLRKLCDKHGIVFIVDEIQAGFGRTGRMFAVEHSGVAPDMITVAKSLAGGLPLSGVIGRAEIMDAPDPGGLGGTYGGNALACAAGLAVLDVIEEERLLDRASRIGDIVVTRLEKLADRKEFQCIGDVRGLGAMCAFELVVRRETREPAASLAKRIQARALESGLVLLSCGVYGNVIRILVPLTVPDAVLEEGLGIVEKSLEETVAKS